MVLPDYRVGRPKGKPPQPGGSLRGPFSAGPAEGGSAGEVFPRRWGRGAAGPVGGGVRPPVGERMSSARSAGSLDVLSLPDDDNYARRLVTRTFRHH
ncbi:hypothetical protein MTBLM5_100013 [Magnetospirillum sp. LM-5]|nr:hypothetical protein MTBLM5_100013 [Magnetospirillum sp. LM-5]